MLSSVYPKLGSWLLQSTYTTARPAVSGSGSSWTYPRDRARLSSFKAPFSVRGRQNLSGPKSR